MWNDQPVVGAVVKMGTGVTYSIPGGAMKLDEPVYETVTDSEGYYVFANVEPGGYARFISAFGFTTFPESSGGISYKKLYIKAGQTKRLDTCHLVKSDVKLDTPASGATVAYDKLVLTWEPYAGASYYEVQLTPEKGAALELESGRVAQTSYAHPQPLLNGKYRWNIIAYNQNGRRIANSAEQEFTVTGATYSMYVEIISPQAKAKVKGTDLILQWKPYPGASYYEVRLATWISFTMATSPVAKVTNTSYSIPRALEPDVYYWAITAYDASNNKLAESGTYSFIVE